MHCKNKREPVCHFGRGSFVGFLWGFPPDRFFSLPPPAPRQWRTKSSFYSILAWITCATRKVSVRVARQILFKQSSVLYQMHHCLGYAALGHQVLFWENHRILCEIFRLLWVEGPLIYRGYIADGPLFFKYQVINNITKTKNCYICNMLKNG